MKKYNWYLFDLDNTILDFNFASKKAFEETLNSFSIEFSERTIKLYHDINISYWQKYEKGKISSETLRIGRFKDFLNEINEERNAKEMSETYLDFLVQHSIEVKGSFKILEKLSKIAKLALITNGLSDVQYKRIEKFKLDRYFKHIFISDEMGVSKPSKKFFEIVYKTLNLPKKETILVLGDNPISDIQGANKFGFHSLYFNFNNYPEKTQSKYTINNWDSFYDL